jgi:hypothetical protein
MYVVHTVFGTSLPAHTLAEAIELRSKHAHSFVTGEFFDDDERDGLTSDEEDILTEAPGPFRDALLAAYEAEEMARSIENESILSHERDTREALALPREAHE